MLLPLSEIEKLNYYHYEPFQKFENGFNARGVVTLYWNKKWYEFWKPSHTKLKFNCRNTEKSYLASDEVVELVAQLNNFIKEKNTYYLENKEKTQREKQVNYLLDKNPQNKKQKLNIL